MREVLWSAGALEDYEDWCHTNPKIRDRIDRLLKAIDVSPERGPGKPKPLRGELSGWWSRRITLEHRLVYRVEGRCIYVLQCRYHY